jgi:hypothetical protein
MKKEEHIININDYDFPFIFNTHHEGQDITNKT